MRDEQAIASLIPMVLAIANALAAEAGDLQPFAAPPIPRGPGDADFSTVGKYPYTFDEIESSRH